jgi:hypothetical protein
LRYVASRRADWGLNQAASVIDVRKGSFATGSSQ